MRKEYELQTDALDTIVAATAVTKKHADLLMTFATRTDYRYLRYVATRDLYGTSPARVVDADGREISPDYRAWIDAELYAHGGSARAVWLAHKDAGYLFTENQRLLHYFVHDRGGQQDNFVQVAVWEEQESVERELLPRTDRSGLRDVVDLRHGSSSMGTEERFQRRELGVPRYRLQEVIDMQRFAAIAEETYLERRRRDGDRGLTETNTATGDQRIVTVRELTTSYDHLGWPGRRFFDDWTESSAGRSGERICQRWTFNTQDVNQHRGRKLSFVPQWTHTRKVAALKNTRNLDVSSLYGKITQFDERIGMPFAWYFYGLVGNLVKRGHMKRVLEAAEALMVVLPDHDYRVLRRWGDAPYGF